MLGFRLSFVLFPIIVILGLASVFAYRYIRSQQTPEFTPIESTFSLEPPKNAVTGILKLATGEVLQKTRQSEDFQEATAGGKVLQGESIATKKGSAGVSFEKIGTVFMGNSAELAAVNLVPNENVFIQKSGTIQYESDPITPLSVRTLHTLVDISGNATINILGTLITVRVTKGSTKLALVDQNNSTQIWTIKIGQQAIVDDAQRKVTVR